MKNLLLMLALCVTMLFTVRPTTGQTNVAFGKTATQSSEAGLGDADGPASKAVDGNTDGNYFNRSVTHTLGSGSTNPWLLVDLGANYQMNEIRIWNRTDCCSERLNDFTILVGNENGQTYNYGPFPSVETTNPIIIPVNVTGRYVTVRLNKENAILSLAEVEVLGSPERQPAPRPTPNPRPLVNLGRAGGMISEETSQLAQNQTIFFLSRQSSRIEGGGYPDNAVDGNRDGDWSSGSITHTKEEYQPFWQADLRDIQDIKEIRIYNRTDCCPERLNDFIIIVSENPINSNTDGILYGQGGYNYNNINPFIFKKSVRARYVRIYLVGTGYLSLAEVEIMGNDNYKACIQAERGVCVQREN